MSKKVYTLIVDTIREPEKTQNSIKYLLESHKMKVVSIEYNFSYPSEE